MHYRTDRRSAVAFSVPWFPAVAFTIAAVAIGCSQSPSDSTAKTDTTAGTGHDHDHGDHDHDDHDHDHPTTLAGAVAAIDARLASLEKAFAAEAHDDADALVHEAGHLLEDGEEFIAKVPEEVATKVREAWDELGDCLSEVDEKLHDSGDDKEAVKKAYEAVKARIGTAMESLRAHVKATAPASDQ